MGMVGMLMGVEHAVEPIDIGIQQLLAQIGRGVDQHPRRAAGRAALYQKRGAPPAVFRNFGSQSPQPSAGRGTPAEDPQPKMVNFGVMRGYAISRLPPGAALCRTRRKKLSVV